MVVLQELLKIAVDFPLHLPTHAGVTTAAIGPADFDSINGGDHSPARPVGFQNAISLQLPGHLATKIENLGGILPLHCITERILADLANPFAQYAAAAFLAQELEAHCLNTVNRTELAGRSKKDGVKNFRPWMSWIVSTFGLRRLQLLPIENLIEIGFKLVALQISSSLSPPYVAESGEG